MLASIFGSKITHTPPVTQHFTAFAETLPSMAGKVIAITGCTSGTGYQLALTCGKLGAEVCMLNRPSSRADKALKDMTDAGHNASLVPIDLMSFESVNAAAQQLHDKYVDKGIDVLVNNAGVMGLLDEATGDGFDKQMQVNHLSAFLLTSKIWPLLEKAVELRGEARVVNHSSGARNKPSKPIVLPEYYGQNGGNLGGDGFPGLDKWRRYQQSKLANLMFTYALADKAAEISSGVKVLCAHPGASDTGLQGKTTIAGGDRYLDRYVLWSTLRNSHSCEDGTMGIATATCQAEVESGAFYGPEGRTGPAVLLPPERNEENQRILWEESMKACGLERFFPAEE